MKSLLFFIFGVFLWTAMATCAASIVIGVGWLLSLWTPLNHFQASLVFVCSAFVLAFMHRDRLELPPLTVVDSDDLDDDYYRAEGQFDGEFIPLTPKPKRKRPKKRRRR